MILILCDGLRGAYLWVVRGVAHEGIQCEGLCGAVCGGVWCRKRYHVESCMVLYLWAAEVRARNEILL